MNDQKPTVAERSSSASRLGAPSLDEPRLDLVEVDVAPERAEQIRRRAHAVLRSEQAAPPVGSFAYRYERSIEPALLIGLALCQAIWVAHGTWLLLR